MSRGAFLATLAVAASACVTVNLYFPTAEVQQAADQIVEEVHQGKTRPPAAGSSLLDRLSVVAHLRSLAEQGPRDLFRWLGPAEARAQERKADIEVSTPAIRTLKERMKDRFPQLLPYYRRGVIGESNMGLLEIASTSGLSLADKAKVRRLVDAENKDRKDLYKEIARANDFPDEQVEVIQKLFANSWREKAEAGWMVQGDDGKWARK
jgi:uncharacterized protein YdbL (DUF1318 family)